MSDKPEINIDDISTKKNGEPKKEVTSQPLTPNEATLPPHKRYIQRMIKFKIYYSQLLLIIGSIIAVSVFIAVLHNLILGASGAILAAILYRAWAVSQMYRDIGLKYSSIVGGIRITACTARYGEIMWIPASLIFFDVIELGDRAFAKRKNEELTKLFLPKTLKYIGEDVFDGCDSLKDIFFEGSEEEWNKIEKNTDFSSYNVIFDAKYPPISKKKNLLTNKK